MTTDTTRPAVGDTLDCGDVLTTPDSIGTGYARTSDGRTICYPCADRRQRETMLVSDVMYGYVSSTGDLTTWTGGILARYVPRPGGVSRNGFHGSEVYAWRFRAADGSEWYGRNGGPGMAIRARRAKRPAAR